jgi:hypothetical protein
MATEKDYQDAIGKVRSGSFSKHDVELAQRSARTAGRMGNQAREAFRVAKEDLERKENLVGRMGNDAREKLKYLR